MAEVELEAGCAKLDQILSQYYKNTGKLDQYYGGKNHNVDSSFAIWVDENGFDDDTLEEELNDDPNEATMTEFDDDFPLDKKHFTNEKQKNLEIFKIMKYCYTKQRAPPMNNLAVHDLDLNVKDDYIEEVDKMLKKAVPGLGEQLTKEADVLYLLSSSKANGGFPVLPTLVDCFARDRLAAKVDDKDPPPVGKWVSNLNIDKKKLGQVEKAVVGYSNRACPLFQYRNINAVDDSVSEIANYIAATSQFIKVLVENKSMNTPFQLDLSIALKNITTTSTIEAPDDDDDIDDPTQDTTKTNQQIGNVQDKLRHEKCSYVDKDLVNMELLKKRFLSDQFDEFKKKLNKKKKYNNYPHKKRFIIFVDRRKQTDKITIFDPPDVCNTLPSHHIREWFFESIRKCIIPRKGFGDGSQEQEHQGSDEKNDDNKNDEVTINALTAAGGKLISFSFHVEQEDKIKCYLFWNSQTIRFYPQDIVEAFKFVFTEKRYKEFRQNKKQINDIMNRIYIKDEQYESFYQSLNKQKNNFIFPKSADKIK